MASRDVLILSENYRIPTINKDNAHYAMAQRCGKRTSRLGIAAITMTTIVSTAILRQSRNRLP
jgi:hypothetical protein